MLAMYKNKSEKTHSYIDLYFNDTFCLNKSIEEILNLIDIHQTNEIDSEDINPSYVLNGCIF